MRTPLYTWEAAHPSPAGRKIKSSKLLWNCNPKGGAYDWGGEFIYRNTQLRSGGTWKKWSEGTEETKYISRWARKKNNCNNSNSGMEQGGAHPLPLPPPCSLCNWEAMSSRWNSTWYRKSKKCFLGSMETTSALNSRMVKECGCASSSR